MAYAATFSIAGRCPRTGMLGVAVASRFLAVGALVPHARGGVGALATQALVNPLYGLDGLELLAGGLPPEQVLDRLLAGDAGRAFRQVGLVDAQGRSAAHTGDQAVPWAGHRTGPGFACQGNMLTGPQVVDAMAAAFAAGAPQALPERLLRALAAGEAAGGDKRGKQAAALLVVDTEAYPAVSLRVDDHPEPVAELQRLWELSRIAAAYRRLLPTRSNPAGVTDPAAIQAVREEISRELAGYRAGDRPEERVRAEFTRQAASLNRSPVFHMAGTLAALVEMLPAAPDQRWLEVACGPGIISRALAPRVAEVVGVDLTPAMVELARREAAAAGVGNARFQVADATALPFPAASFAGAVTRFSLHHIPNPAACVAEMARVVVPGGYVAIADHLTAADAAEAAWHQQVERLRDPSHHQCLTADQIRGLAASAGLQLVSAQVEPLVIDYEEWLTRGSGGAANRSTIAALLAQRPEAGCFRVRPGADGRPLLHLLLGRFLFRQELA